MSCNHEYTNQEGRALEKLVIQIEQQLAAAKAELAELKEKYEAQNDAIVIMENSIADDVAKTVKIEQRAEQAEAQCVAYKKALDSAMSTNQSHETYCKVEAALEEKP